MKLLVAIVQDEDADKLSNRLNEREFRVTRINSAGGFLARGNVTFLVGLEDERIPEVTSIIRETCRTRRAFVNPMPWGPEIAHLAITVTEPLEVQVGGATVFVLPVVRHLRIQGGQPAPEDDGANPNQQAPGDTVLMLAIVSSEDAGPVSRALLAAGHRLTRINTAGAFLRRGNTTLLIGVEQRQVNEVVRLIADNCQPRAEAKPLESGMPMYSATVFVLPASLVFRI